MKQHYLLSIHLPPPPPAKVGGAPGGGVGILVGDGGHEAGVSIHVVGDGHETVVREPHVVRPVYATIHRRLLVAVVVAVLLVVHLPLEVVLWGDKGEQGSL